MNNKLPEIHCTTVITLRNTKTGHIYKDVSEKESDINNPNTQTKTEHVVQDVNVQVSPRGLNVLQKVKNQKNEEPKS